jgi:hypothetical protein
MFYRLDSNLAILLHEGEFVDYMSDDFSYSPTLTPCYILRVSSDGDHTVPVRTEQRLNQGYPLTRDRRAWRI